VNYYTYGPGAYDAGEARHIDSRPRLREILSVACPRCGAPPWQWCDRSDWKPRSAYEKRLAAEGTPRSHRERFYLAQNGDAEREPGTKTVDTAKIPADFDTRAPCPRCHAPKGMPCRDRSGELAPRPHEARLRLAAARWIAKQNWRHKRRADKRRAYGPPELAGINARNAR
jgi:hypothetical protein